MLSLLVYIFSEFGSERCIHSMVRPPVFGSDAKKFSIRHCICWAIWYASLCLTTSSRYEARLGHRRILWWLVFFCPWNPSQSLASLDIPFGYVYIYHDWKLFPSVWGLSFVPDILFCNVHLGMYFVSPVPNLFLPVFSRVHVKHIRSRGICVKLLTIFLGFSSLFSPMKI